MKRIGIRHPVERDGARYGETWWDVETDKWVGRKASNRIRLGTVRYGFTLRERAAEWVATNPHPIWKRAA